MSCFPSIKIGVDVSCDELVLDSNDKDKNFIYQHFANTLAGISAIQKLLDKSQHHIIIEATGSYSMLLAYELTQNGYVVSVVNPKQIKYFTKMLLQTAQNDDIDARLIAQYATALESKLRLFKPKSDAILKLQQYRILLNGRIKYKNALSNQLHAIRRMPQADKALMEQMKEDIKELATKIKNLRNQLVNVGKQEYDLQFAQLNTIKGIGPVIAMALIMATNGFKEFKSAKQFARFIGICPTFKFSGKTVRRKGHISRSGDPELRRVLYLGAWSAIKYNSACKKFYERLINRGKAPNVALMGVMNKLIKQAFALIRKNEDYIDGHTSKKTTIYKQIPNLAQ